MNIRLKPSVQKKMERGFDVRDGLVEVALMVIAEWESDPTSVQCFDLRLVKKAIELKTEWKGGLSEALNIF